MDPARPVVRVDLGELSVKALSGGGAEVSLPLGTRLAQATRYYLAEKDSNRPGWPYPSFRRADESDCRVGVELRIDEAIWAAFGQEADLQGVSVDQLAEHAALYFSADLDAGRITQRILDDLS